MILQVDTTGAASSTLFDQLTQLEGVEYLLRFCWSDREACWYLDIQDQDGNPIAQLIRLVLGASLLRRFDDSRLPPGALFLVDLTGTGLDMAASADLGVGYQLTYVTSDDALFS